MKGLKGNKQKIKTMTLETRKRTGWCKNMSEQFGTKWNGPKPSIKQFLYVSETFGKRLVNLLFFLCSLNAL